MSVFQKIVLTAAKIVPVANSSQISEGKLSPEEFVAAGDFLVAKCGQWAWCSANGKAFKNYLPRDKQYLLSKNSTFPPPHNWF